MQLESSWNMGPGTALPVNARSMQFIAPYRSYIDPMQPSAPLQAAAAQTSRRVDLSLSRQPQVKTEGVTL